MSNSYTSPPLLTDPARLGAGQTVRSTEFKRLGDAQNYSIAHGGCNNVISQFWDAEVFEYTSTSMTNVCSWYVPNPSEEHTEFKVRLSASSSGAGALAKIKITFPLSGNSYTDQITISDSTRFNNVFDVATVSITSAEDEAYCIVSLSLKSSSGTIEIAGIQGNWSPLSSPLPTRLMGQYGADITPSGIVRLGDDQALTSRFGVESINNINQIRKRGRVLLNWSGVFSASSAAAQGIGALDGQILYSLAAIFAGMSQNSLDVDIFVNVAGLTSSNTPLLFDVFGYRLALTLSGWNSYGVDLRLPEHDLSDQFGLSMYRVGVSETAINTASLLSKDNPLGGSPAYIRGLSIVSA